MWGKEVIVVGRDVVSLRVFVYPWRYQFEL